MSANTFKRLNVADTFVAPYTANKSWEISSASFAEKRIITNVGVNQNGSIFDPNSDYNTNGQYDRLVYDSINLLYYPSFFPTGSPLFYSERLNSPIFDSTFTSASYWKGHINLGNLDTTKYFPTTTGSVIYVLNIPKSLASEKILPNTFEVYFSSGSNYTAKIYDDGNYNLFYSGSNVSSSIGTVLSQSSYVGNVFYEQNVAILTVVPNSIRLMGWIGADPYCIQATAASPSVTPSISRTPSLTPTRTPTVTPSKTIPRTPSLTPTRTPSVTVSVSPGTTPSLTPTRTPSLTPTRTPTRTPSLTPTITPSSSGFYDNLTGTFTLTNRVESSNSVLVALGGYGDGGIVNINSSSNFSPSGQITTTAVFSISATGFLDPINITSNTLSCTGATVSVTGGGTSNVTITITPFNYDVSTDSISGTLTFIVG